MPQLSETQEIKCEIRVSVRPSYDGGKIYCEQYWSGVEVDRPHTYSIVLRNTQIDMEIALAYQDAVSKGLIYSDPRVVFDNSGKSYVTCDGFVMGNYLEDDLRKLGYLGAK